MPFIKQSSILIRNSFNNLYTISVENGISINYVNSNFEIKKQKNFGSTPKCVLDSIKLSRHVYYILKKFLLHNTLYSL